MKQQYINFSPVHSLYEGVEILRLFHVGGNEDGKEYLPFTMFMQDLVDSNKAPHTVKQYGYRQANYLDYMAEGCKFLSLSKANINLLHRGYHSYLIHGPNAASEVVKKICRTKLSPLVGVDTSSAYHAPIELFVKFSRGYLDKLADYKESGFNAGSPYDLELLGNISEIKTSVKPGEERGRNNTEYARSSNGSSMTAHKKTDAHVPSANGGIIFRLKKFFPLNKITQLIRSATCYRDAALWSLMAATSLRASEVLQVLREDINYAERQIYAVDPKLRKNFSKAYRGLSEVQANKLCWKSRTTPYTALLEPYGTLFFYYLELYKQYEYIPGCGHNFIFQTRDGAPLFLSDYSSVVLVPFKRAANSIFNECGISGKGMGLHSLRHSYIYFMKNFLEHNRGVGLSDSELMQLTGHRDIRGLMCYAKADYEIVLEKISYGNAKRRASAPLSEAEHQVKYLSERLAMFKHLVNEEAEND